MKFSISILTYTALAQAKACLAAVLSSHGDFELILTANGNPEAAKYFVEIAQSHTAHRIRVVINEKNEGFIEPNKHALAICDGDIFVLLNDDAIPPSDWLQKFEAEFNRFPNAALVGIRDGCSALHANFHGTMGPFEYLEGSCLACKACVVKEHGLFSPELKWAYGEDSDLSLRMRELGYTLHKADLRLLRHERGATSRHLPDVLRWQEANHQFLRQRWAHYLRTRTFEYPIILRRGGAFGDVLLLTPIIRELKRTRPLSKIYIETACREVFERNPYVERADHRIAPMQSELRINLDNSYENNPSKNFVQTYADAAGVKVSDDRTELYVPKSDADWARRTLSPDRWIGISAGPTWETKELSNDKWADLIARLQADGFKIVVVGKPSKTGLPRGDLDMRGITTIAQLGALIALCEIFICVDSFPMHVAQAVGTPIVPMFGITLPGPILTSGSKSFPVLADQNHPSAGLRHKVSGKTFTPAAMNPMDTITADMVYEAAKRALQK